jgi:hypothetical protein
MERCPNDGDDRHVMPVALVYNEQHREWGQKAPAAQLRYGPPDPNSGNFNYSDTPLSASLAPAPVMRFLPGGGCATVGVAWIGGVFTALGAATVALGGQQGFFGIFFLLPGLALLITGVRMTRRVMAYGTAYRIVESGEPTAREVWSRASYCFRCGTVFFPGSRAAGWLAPDVPLDTPIAPSVFKRMVWRAGGYEQYLDSEFAR